MLLAGKMRAGIHLLVKATEFCLNVSADGYHCLVLHCHLIEIVPCVLQLLRTADARNLSSNFICLF